MLSESDLEPLRSKEKNQKRRIPMNPNESHNESQVCDVMQTAPYCFNLQVTGAVWIAWSPSGPIAQNAIPGAPAAT